MRKPSEQIEDAQHKLQNAIRAALNAFSEETGLSVPSATWEVAHTLDAKGHTKKVDYRYICTHLASCAWQA